jgi:hypothetical protein
MNSPDARSTPRSMRQKVALLLVNCWLVFHLVAVVAAPSSVSPSSELIRTAWQGCRPYLQLLYLNHGYHFFAPEPSSSTLVAYTSESEERPSIVGRIPNRQIWPRLLYHRHFMLTEFLNFAPDDMQETWYRSYAKHLGHKHNADRISLTKVTHYLPTMEMVRDGVTLDAPDSFAEEPLGLFECDEL